MNAPATSDGDEVVKVETNLITIPVSVFDRNGLYIPNLKKEDFKIFEDGKEQQIEYFGTTEKPFTLILLLDTSPSTEYEIDEIRDAAKAFVDQLKPQDKVMVVAFDGRVHVLTEATGDRPAIYKAIEKADFGNGTALYDAVSFSISKRMSSVSGRKAIVLFTDGVDTQSSKSNYDTTLALAEEADSLIFPIYYNTYEKTRADAGDPLGMPPPGSTAREYAVGKKYLEELASYTGGRVFRPESTPGGLTAAFEGIAEELRRQYSIGYIPTEDGKPGQRKQIKVRVDRPNLVLRARDSYIVGAK
ncbi:MAG: VWA domain-containing protein [Acidobacteriota bacterium]